MIRPLLAPLLITLACATVQPHPVTDYGDEGGGGFMASVRRDVMRAVTGQAAMPSPTPSQRIDGPYKWASRPSATGRTGDTIRISDIGTGGSLWMSDGADWQPVNAQLRTSVVRVGTFGDSTANFGTPQSPDTQDATIYTASFPASGATTLGKALNKWALDVLYPQAFVVVNGGISGESTTSMLARDAAASSTTRKAITDVLAAKPDVVLFRGGSINDVQALSAPISQASLDTIYNQHVILAERLMSGGALVIDEGIFGYSPGSGTQADIDARRAALLSLNTRFEAYAATQPGKIVFLDTLNMLHDSTGAFLSNTTVDGIHLSVWGQYLVSQAEAAILSQAFGRSGGPRYPGANLITNALMHTTGSVAFGTTATGFAVGAFNSTRQNAKIETLWGRRWQTCEYVITGANATGTIYMPFDPTTMGIVANDVYGFEFDFFVQDVSGSPLASMNSIFGRVDVYKSGAGRVIAESTPTVTTGLGGTLRGRMVFNPFKFSEPSANLTTSSVFNFNFGTSALSGTFKMGVSMPRIVKQ